MEAIAAIGSLIFLGSLVYLVYHSIRKIKNRNRKLPKKSFYSALIGGLVLLIIGSVYTDTSTQAALEEAQKENIELIAQNKEMKSSHTQIEKENAKLQEDNKEAKETIDQLTAKLATSEKSAKELADKQSTNEEKSTALEKEVTSLKEKNTALTNEVSSLKGQVASKNANQSATSTSNSSGTSTGVAASKPNQQSSNVYFKNCTAARAAGAAPVHRGDPGYGKHLDRDGDGVGCE